MKKYIILTLAFLSIILPWECFSANPKVMHGGVYSRGSVVVDVNGSTGITASSNSSLDLKDTDKYLLPNRMTTTQRDNISSPEQGATIYNITTELLNYYDSTATEWKEVGDVSLTADRALISDGSGDISSSSVTSTELGYVSGVTSSIQTQLNAKQANVITAQGSLVVGGVGGTPEELTIGTNGQVPVSNGTTITWSDATAGANAETVVSVNDFTANSGFERGDVTNWTNSGATASVQAVTVLDGSYSLSWDAAADGDTFTSDAFTIPEKLKNNNVVFCLTYQGGDSNIRFVANDGTNDFLDEALSAQTNSRHECFNAIMPDVSTITVRLEADADAAIGYFDNFTFALASTVNISNISQAQESNIVISSDASHDITITDSSWTNLSDVDIVEGDYTTTGIAEKPITGNIAVGYTNLAPARYEVEFSGARLFGLYGTTTTSCSYGIYDGTNIIGEIDVSAPSTSAVISISSIKGAVTYTKTQASLEFTIQAKRTAGDGSCRADLTTTDALITVKSFPTTSQTSINPSTQMVASGVKITADADHVFSTTSATYAVADDPDIIAADKTHYGTATITTDESNFGFTMPYLKANTRYLVWANASMFGVYSTTAGSVNFSISDGTTTIAEGSQNNRSDSTRGDLSYIAGTISYDSVQTDKEFTLYAMRESGGGSAYIDIRYIGAEIGIIPLTEGMNMPQILNNVESSASGGVRLCGVTVTNSGTPTVTSEEGNCVDSLTDTATGRTIVNFTTGTFSSAPFCTVSSTDTGYNDIDCDFEAMPSSSQAKVICESGAGTDADKDFSITCWGPK